MRKADASSDVTLATAQQAVASEASDKILCERIYDVIRAAWGYGATDDEAKGVTGIFEGTVHRRRADLWEAKRICPFMIAETKKYKKKAGYTRLTARGKPAQVFIVVEVAYEFNLPIVWMTPALQRYLERIGDQSERFVQQSIKYLQDRLKEKQ